MKISIIQIEGKSKKEQEDHLYFSNNDHHCTLAGRHDSKILRLYFVRTLALWQKITTADTGFMRSNVCFAEGDEAEGFGKETCRALLKMFGVSFRCDLFLFCDKSCF